jgi:IS5 family transposase
MTILPETLQIILAPYLNLLQQWFSEQVYERILHSNRNHVLVLIHQHYDFGSLEVACQEYHHQTGPGAKPTHSIKRLVRGLLIKYICNLSHAHTEEQVCNNLLMRWFVGYGLFEPVFDHTTLYRFENWLRLHGSRQYFDEVLKQINQDFPSEEQVVQIGDTFAVRANAAEESLEFLLRHTCRKLLACLQNESITQYERVVGGYDFGPLYGAPDEVREYFLTQDECLARLKVTTQAAIDLCARIHASGQLDHLPGVQVQLKNLEKVIADEMQIERNSSGQVEQVERLPSKKRGSYRIGSATDPEATWRTHGGNSTLGYNASLAITPDAIIREIQAATGAEPDQAGVSKLIEAQALHQEHCPQKLIFDQAGGAGKTRAEVSRVSQGQTKVVAGVTTSANPDRFCLSDFQLADDRLSITCPNGYTCKARRRSSNSDGHYFAIPASKCRNCPLKEKCRSPKSKPTSERRIFVSDYLDEILAAEAYNKTETFKSEMKLRPQVERVISVLTRYDGARRARCLGQKKVDFQLKMCAAARNLRTWMKMKQDREKADDLLPGVKCAC